MVDPEYSDEAYTAKREGTVVLSLVVQKDGTATDVRAVRSLGLGLDEKAVAAVKNWRFRPADKGRHGRASVRNGRGELHSTVLESAAVMHEADRRNCPAH
jgi:TonB family protein